MTDRSAIKAAGVPGSLPIAGLRSMRPSRITADSFRSLTARLKGSADLAVLGDKPQLLEIPELLIPDLLQPASQGPTEHASAEPDPAVAPAASEPALPDFPEFDLPAFIPLEPAVAGASEVAQPSLGTPDREVSDIIEAADTAPAPAPPLPLPDELTSIIEQVFAAPHKETPVIEPQPPPEEVEPEARPEEPPPFNRADSNSQHPDHSPEVPLVFVKPESAPLPEPELTPSSELAKPTSALVEKVVDAALKTVTDAIYAKPTQSEREAFLREVAALNEEPAEASAGPGEEILPPQPEPEPPLAANETPDLAESLANRLGPAAPLLRRQEEQPDPFSKTIKDVILVDPKPTETVDADESSGELALSLLDMMSGGAGSGLPQERALAADTLLRMIPRVPVRQLIAVVERMAIMESPPSLLVAKLIRDRRPEVVAPLLERCMHITDQDLMTAAAEGDTAKRRMIARRRVLSTVMADYLIADGEPSVLLTLIRNPGAVFSHEAFHRLATQASAHNALLAPLCTRADLPAPVAFELFWFVPPELRRFIFSRFLTDSETLNKILKIALATQEGGEARFPARETLDEAIGRTVEGKLEQAAQLFATAAGISPDTALRVLCDRDGEPMAVILKALGYPRASFESAMQRLQGSDFQLLNSNRNLAELQSIFDMLSFNKARILLTYWDWYVLKSGPYAPQN